MITIHLDEMMLREKISHTELADRLGITSSNLSVLKNGKGKAVRFSTLNALCAVLHCQPGDILKYERASDDPTYFSAARREFKGKEAEAAGADLPPDFFKQMQEINLGIFKDDES